MTTLSEHSRPAPDRARNGPGDEGPGDDRPDNDRRKRRGRRAMRFLFRPVRWLLGLLVILLVLLVIVAVVVAFVLNSDLPRQVAQDQAQKQTGLRIEIGAVDVGVFGNTVVRDVTVSLPLAAEPFARVAVLEVEHTSLPVAILTLGLSLQEVRAGGTQLDVIETRPGEWNLLQAVEIVRAATARPDSGGGGPPPIPALLVPDARLSVQLADGRRIVVDPVRVVGEPVGNVRYDARVEIPSPGESPPYALVAAEVGLNPTFNHDVSLSLHNLRPLATPLVQLPQTTGFTGRLVGQVNDGVYTGRLQIEEAAFGPRRLGLGTLRVRAGGEGPLATVTVLNLDVTDTGLATPGRVQLTQGRALFADDVLRLEDLQGQTLGGRFRAGGSYNLSTNAADFEARYSEIAYAGVTASGTASAGFTPTFDEGGRATATLITRGTGPVVGQFGGRVDVVASGRSLNRFDYSLTASDLTVQDRRAGTVSMVPTLRATGRLRTDTEGTPDDPTDDSTTIYLDGLRSIEGGDIRAQGSVTLYPAAADGTAPSGAAPSGTTPTTEPTTAPDSAGPPRIRGYLFVEAEEVPLDLPKLPPVLAEGGVDLAFADDFFQLRNLYVNAGDITFGGSGYYNFAEKPEEDPLEAYLYLNHRQLPPEEALLPASGTFLSTLEVKGYADPRDLDKMAVAIRGEALANEFILGDYEVGTLRAELIGSADRGRLRLRMPDVQFLETVWQLGAVYPFDDARPIRFNITFDDLPLTELTAFLPQLPTLEGTAGLSLDVESFGISVGGLSAKGQLNIEDFALSEIRAEEIDIPLNLNGPRLNLGPIVARQGEGLATITADYNLDNPNVITVGLDVDSYPLSLQDELVKALLTATSDGVTINLSDPDPRVQGQTTVQGRIDVDGQLQLDGQEAGTYAAQVVASGRVFEVKEINADVIGGEVTGFFRLDLDQLENLQGRLFGDNLQGARVAERLPQAAPLKGTYGFELSLRPSNVARDVGPSRMDFNLFPSEDAAFGATSIGTIDITAYLTLTESGGIQRFVTQDALIRIADGVISPFFRVSRQSRDVRTPTGGYTSTEVLDTLLDVNFSALDLNQIVRTANEETTNVQGRLRGNVNAFGVFDNLAELKGRGRLEILDARLAELNLVERVTERQEQLADADGEFAGRDESGTLNFQLEGGRLELSNIYLFANNAEIRGRATVSDISELTQSPLEGFLVVTFRPLKDVRLPFLGGATDELLTAVQKGTGATAFRVGGTLTDYKINPAPLSEVGNAVQGLLLQDAKRAQE